MKNRLQTLAIVLLSISAILLFMLNLGTVNISQDIEPEPDNIFDSEALISDGILPYEIIISFGQGDYTTYHNKGDDGIWNYSIDLIRSVFRVDGTTVSSIKMIEDEVYKELLSDRFVLLSFSARVNMPTILNALEVGETEEFSDRIDDVGSIYISLDKPIIVVGSDDGYREIKVEYLATDNIDKEVTNLYLSDYIPYYAIDKSSGDLKLAPNINNIDIPLPKVENLLKDIDHQYIENIVAEFLNNDINSVREIDDADGTIFIEDERILKIGTNGYIEYKNSAEIKNKEKNLFKSLQSALEFISNTSGYDDSLYIKNILEIQSEDSPGFSLSFGKLSQGLPIEIIDNEIGDYITVDVYSTQVENLKQLMRKTEDDGYYYTGSSKDTITEVLKENMSVIEEDFEDYTIDDIYDNIQYSRIVYYDDIDSDRLGLMWKIIIEDKVYMFKIN